MLSRIVHYYNAKLITKVQSSKSELEFLKIKTSDREARRFEYFESQLIISEQLCEQRYRELR